MKGIKTQKGITLIALIITIVVLLILAVVAISAINDSGIIGHAKNAQTEHEIGEEKEKVTLSVNEAYLAGLGTITEENLDKALESNFGTGNYSLDSSNSEYFKVTITKSGREYKVYKNGKVEGTLGSSGGENNDLPGDNAEVLKISAIEDLVDFSMIINAGDPDGIYTGKTVTLEKSLDFEDPASYRTVNPETTKYIKDGVEVDANGDGTIEPIMTELTQGVGFNPIGMITEDVNPDTGIPVINSVSGIFEGNNNTIYNLYINRPDDAIPMAGLFRLIYSSATIQNLKVTGDLKSSGYAGGIAGAIYGLSEGEAINIKNCHVENLKVEGAISSGIVGMVASMVDVNIENCTSSSDTIIGNADVTYGGSGIAFLMQGSNVTVNNCTNNAKIYGEYSAGIAFASYEGEIKKLSINDCKNYGEINGSYQIAGIHLIDDSGVNELYMNNCINYANLKSTEETRIISGIVNTEVVSTAQISNCINNGSIYVGENAQDVDYVVGVANLYLNDTTEPQIVECTNNGTITVDGDVNYLAGVTTLIDPNRESLKAEVIRCNNYGKIECNTNNTSTRTTSIGGCIAVEADASFKITVDNCNNYGEINVVTTKKAGVGGVAKIYIRFNRCCRSNCYTM